MKRNGFKAKNRETREAKTVIEGKMMAAEYEGNGSIMELNILTSDEEEYFIENGEMFMNLAGKNVRASGILREGRRGIKTFHIKKISVLDSESDDMA